MRLTQTLRVLAVAVLLLLGTAVLWWLVGYPIGKGILGETGNLGAFRRSFGYDERHVVRLFALALAVPVTQAIAAAAPAQARWMMLAATALGAALLYDDKSGGAVLGVALFVFAVAGVAEESGVAQIVAAVAAAVVVAFAFTIDSPFGAGEKMAVIALRAVFFFAPLLLGAGYVERYALQRARGK